MYNVLSPIRDIVVFGYDQRVELFGSKGMLISGNKKENETEIYSKNNTSTKKTSS